MAYWKNTNPIKDIRLIIELYKIYRNINPDIVLHYTHKPNIYGGIAAKWKAIKSYAVVTGLGYSFIHKGLSNKIIKVLYKFSCRFHHKVIFENKDDLQLFINSGLLPKGKGVSIKGCGVDTAIYLPYPNGQVSEKTIFTFVEDYYMTKG